PRPGEREAGVEQARDLRLGVAERIDGLATGGRRPSLARLGEVDAPGQLADDYQVDAVEDLGPERRGRDELRPGANGPQVGVEAERLPESEERLLGAN